MKDIDGKLDRLLQSAAQTGDETPIEAPFGFDTRVVALWRANENGASRGLGRLIRRVAVIAGAVIVVATAGAYREINQSRDISEPFANEFVIADSAIQDEFLQ
jgi:hypothetical protein